MSTEKSVQPVGPALIPAERERRCSTSWSLRLADSDGHWWSMDQLNGIWKWIRLGGFAQLILLPLLLDLSFSRLLPLPFSLIFLSYPRAIYFVLSSSYTPDNWTDCSVLPDFSSPPCFQMTPQPCRNACTFLFIYQAYWNSGLSVSATSKGILHPFCVHSPDDRLILRSDSLLLKCSVALSPASTDL